MCSWKEEVHLFLRRSSFARSPEAFFARFKQEPALPPCPSTDVELHQSFFRIVNEPNIDRRKHRLRSFFLGCPHDRSYLGEGDDDDEQWTCAMWKIAGNLSGLPAGEGLKQTKWWHQTGITRCAIELLRRQTDAQYLEHGRNRYAVYYLAAILGSLVHNYQPIRDRLRMVDEGALDVLVPLLNGSCTWAEARIASRAVGHLLECDYDQYGETMQLGDAGAIRLAQTALDVGAVAALAHVASTLDDMVVTQNLIHPARAGSLHRDQFNVDRDTSDRVKYVAKIHDGRRFAISALGRMAKASWSCSDSSKLAAPGVQAALVLLLCQGRTESMNLTAQQQHYTEPDLGTDPNQEGSDGCAQAIQIVEHFCTADTRALRSMSTPPSGIAAANVAGGIPSRAPLFVNGGGMHRFLFPFICDADPAPFILNSLRGLAAVPECAARLWHDGLHLHVLPLLTSTEVEVMDPSTNSVAQGWQPMCGRLPLAVTILKMLAGLPAAECITTRWADEPCLSAAIVRETANPTANSALSAEAERAAEALASSFTGAQQVGDRRHVLMPLAESGMQEEKQEGRSGAGGAAAAAGGGEAGEEGEGGEVTRLSLLRQLQLLLHRRRAGAKLVLEDKERLRELQQVGRDAKAEGNALFKGGQFKAAVQAYAKAVELSPVCTKTKSDRLVFLSNEAEAHLQIVDEIMASSSVSSSDDGHCIDADGRRSKECFNALTVEQARTVQQHAWHAFTR
jgi:hypothetical protein